MFAIAQLVSPLLPAALVVGQSVAAGRLREKNIFCVDLTRILMAGKGNLKKKKIHVPYPYQINSSTLLL